MRLFFSTLPRNVIDCFNGRMIIWHVLAISLTLILVTADIDSFYFRSTRDPILQHWLFPAVPIGGLLPIGLPLMLLLLGRLAGSSRVRNIGWAIGQAELIGALIAASYKAFTGRAHPSRVESVDLTHVFHFGFLRGGVFWGWPSSHTTVAFAMAVTLLLLFPKQKWLGFLAIAYAFYVGIGVSISIHWFSDFVAGAIIGSLVGVVVGRCFDRDLQEISCDLSE
jgi:membrane-associated phospholipid phosphatase